MDLVTLVAACKPLSTTGVKNIPMYLYGEVFSHPGQQSRTVSVWFNYTACHTLLPPLNNLGQLADQYYHWCLEFFFFRISESTTGYIFTPCVGSFSSPGIDTR